MAPAVSGNYRQSGDSGKRDFRLAVGKQHRRYGNPRGESRSIGADNQSVGESGNNLQIGLELTNVGTGAAQNISVSQVAVRALGGTGMATYISPTLPITIGGLSLGESARVTLIISVPATVAKLSLTEQGSVQDTAGNSYRFSLAQVVLMTGPLK